MGRRRFALAWVLLAGTGLLYKLAAATSRGTSYRAAVALAVTAALVLVWMNLAVGLIGNEDNPANLLYGGVLAVALIGACVARLQPRGMARAMCVTALVQALVPVIALMMWRPQITWGGAPRLRCKCDLRRTLHWSGVAVSTRRRQAPRARCGNDRLSAVRSRRSFAGQHSFIYLGRRSGRTCLIVARL